MLVLKKNKFKENSGTANTCWFWSRFFWELNHHRPGSLSFCLASRNSSHLQLETPFADIQTPAGSWAFMEQEGGAGERTPESQFSHWNLKFSHQIHKCTFCHRNKKTRGRFLQSPFAAQLASAFTCVLNSKGWMETGFPPPRNYCTNIWTFSNICIARKTWRQNHYWNRRSGIRDEFAKGKIHVALQHLLPKNTPEQKEHHDAVWYSSPKPNPGKSVRTSSAGKHKAFNWELNTMEHTPEVAERSSSSSVSQEV